MLAILFVFFEVSSIHIFASMNLLTRAFLCFLNFFPKAEIKQKVLYLMLSIKTFQCYIIIKRIIYRN